MLDQAEVVPLCGRERGTPGERVGGPLREQAAWLPLRDPPRADAGARQGEMGEGRLAAPLRVVRCSFGSPYGFRPMSAVTVCPVWIVIVIRYCADESASGFVARL